MIKFVDEGETLLYRARKSRGPILFMFIFMPIWLYFASIFFIPCFKAFFLGISSADPSEYYIAGMVVLLLFMPIAILIPLSYFLNRLVITDQRVYIRKGISGKSQIFNLSDICSFQHAVSRGRNQSNHKILFYLSCGKLIKTGELYANLYSLQTLLELLRSKFEGRGYTGSQLKEMQNNNAVCQVMTKRNPVPPMLLLLPFILALILSGFYFFAG